MPTQPPSPRHRPPSRTIFLASVVESVAISPDHVRLRPVRAISSVGERFLHTEEATGSIPVSPTICLSMILIPR